MNILVCISCVPDTTSKITFTQDRSSFEKTGIQWVINPYDEFTLSKAVQLRENLGAKVTVLTVGTEETESVIRKALAMGADEGLRINYEPKDSYATAKQIHSVIQDKNYDLILCGRESIDYNGGSVPGMLAQLLGNMFINASVGLKLEEGKAIIVREIEGGKETISAALPLVIAGQKGLVEESELIIPNMRGIMSSRTKPLEVIQGKTVDTPVHYGSFESVPPRSSVKLIEEDRLDELVKILREEAKVI
ncbi:MAG: electron transfer flavoprotein subunit beta/FixA family protein [Bergeyella sp.]|nr:electron transfer flavoprotein subunit beta/FixA family protein [Bergeyella sp.]